MAGRCGQALRPGWLQITPAAMTTVQARSIRYRMRGSALWSRGDRGPVAAGLVALLVAVPIMVVVSSLATPSLDVWAHLWQTRLLELLWNTHGLIVGDGL